MYPLSVLVGVGLLSFLLGVSAAVWMYWWVEDKGKKKSQRIAERPRCPVEGCQIQRPHSHTEDLLRRMKGR